MKTYVVALDQIILRKLWKREEVMRVRVVLEQGANITDVSRILQDVIDEFSAPDDFEIIVRDAPQEVWSDPIRRADFVRAQPAKLLREDEGLEWAVYAVIDRCMFTFQIGPPIDCNAVILSVQHRDGITWTGFKKIEQSYSTEQLSLEIKGMLAAIRLSDPEDCDLDTDTDLAVMGELVCAIYTSACDAHALAARGYA